VAVAPPPPVHAPVEYPSGHDYTFLCTKPNNFGQDKRDTKANYHPNTFAQREQLLKELPEHMLQIDQGTDTIIASYILFIPQSTVVIQERPSERPLNF
jgi:hypothetical protein